MKPSDFLKKGDPYCSIFGETWHESTAITYLQCLVIAGDKWDKLSPDEVQKLAMQIPIKVREPGLMSILRNPDRIASVANALTCAEDAKNFSPAWKR